MLRDTKKQPVSENIASMQRIELRCGSRNGEPDMFGIDRRLQEVAKVRACLTLRCLGVFSQVGGPQFGKC